jgi:release factor glutamine methyltransferase
VSRTLDRLHLDAARRLMLAGVETPRLDARLLIQHALGLDHTAFITNGALPIDAAGETVAFSLIQRRAAREPVGRILGHRGFWTLDVQLSPETLEPRPDTETLVEAVLARIADRNAALRIVDLGTGSGCIVLALLAELPNAWGLGVDRSAGAAATARTNALHAGLTDRAAFVVGDWAGALAGPFDIVVSNPPYIPTADIATLSAEVRRFDPLLALDGGADGLHAYRQLIAALPTLLAPSGRAVFEIGVNQAPMVTELLTNTGICAENIVQDLQGIERCVIMRHDMAGT